MKAKIFNIQKFSTNDGEGIRTTVFFSGCNLNCKWCANPECKIIKKEYDLKDLMSEVMKDKSFYDKSGGGVTLSGGEIFMQTNFVKEFIKELHKKRINVAIETAGNISKNIFSDLINSVDFVFMDLKHYNSYFHELGTGKKNNQIIENIDLLVKSLIPYTIRIPVIPDFNSSLKDAENFCILLKKLNVSSIELLPFHQYGEGKYEKYNLPYEYKDKAAIKKEDLYQYKKIFEDAGFDIILK